MLRYLVAMLIIIVFVSCMMTSIQTIRKFDTNNSYLFGKFKEYEYTVVLKNLDTLERVYVKFGISNKIQISEIIPGDYALLSISGYQKNLFGGDKSLRIEMPIELMKVIKIKPGTALYLGEFEVQMKFDFNPFIDGEFQIQSKLLEAVQELYKKYKIDDISFMTIFD